MKKSEYLVIGNSTAAVAAIEGIREQDGQTPIVLVAGEPHHTYSRPMIPYILAGEADDENLYFRSPDFYVANGVIPQLGVSVNRIDPDNRTARTDEGEEISFSRLLIATGGKAIIPPIEGADAEGIFTFTSWNDAKAIAEYIEPGTKRKSIPKAVIIGAGLIGIKALEALRKRSLETLIVESEDRVMPLSTDKEGSQIIESAIWDAGADVQCGTRVRRILKDAEGRVSGVMLETGREVSCELVIAATGVAPDIGLVEATSIEVGRGIVVDKQCMTSVKDIYAAGDVTQSVDVLSDACKPTPIFPNAFRQGRIAGINMAGGHAVMRDCFAMNSTTVFGLPVISVGLATASGDEFEVLETGDANKRIRKRIVLRDNRVVGALSIGNIDRAGILTGLIREKVDIGSIKNELLASDFGILSLPSEYRKHIVRGEGIEV